MYSECVMINRKKLTPKQYAFLQFIREYLRETGSWPTYGDLALKFDFRSPNSVTQNLQALVKKGYLKRAGTEYHFTNPVNEEEEVGIPIRGVVTAGRLQEAVEAHLGTITLDTLFPQAHRMFALRVHGASMRDEGIQHGDYVLLIDDDIPQGGIGAVLYNGETTLKRIYTTEKGLMLVPANQEFPNVYIHPQVFEEVRVLGRYIGRVTNKGAIQTLAA